MDHSLKWGNSYFIAGIGTDIGKTFFVENLICKLLKKNIPINAIKPIASGFAEGDANSDSVKILSALSSKLPPFTRNDENQINSITPWRFAEGVSPHIAAQNVNQEINFLEVVNFCQKNIASAKEQNKILLIESAGGLMTPINDDKTFLDLAFELKIPVLLLSANYLGSISHTLCAITALKNKEIAVKNIIINDGIFIENNAVTPISKLIKTFENFTKIKTLTLNNFIELQ
jgi:dethiobiotin synthetase